MQNKIHTTLNIRYLKILFCQINDLGLKKIRRTFRLGTYHCILPYVKERKRKKVIHTDLKILTIKKNTCFHCIYSNILIEIIESILKNT